MLKKEYGDKFIYVWEYNANDRKDVKTVKHNSLKYIYHIMTSRVLISNTGISAVFPLRKSQMVINTWHGSGAYKKVGKDIDSKVNGTSDFRIRLSNKNLTYFVSGCRKFSEVMSGALGLDIDKFLPIGMPRNDLLIDSSSNAQKDYLKEKIGIEKNYKIVLYAPTFRGATGNPDADNFNLNIESLLVALSTRFGGEWVFAYRCHYSIKSQFKITDKQKSIDLSDYDDMQELLLIADFLISDYSSVVWDYSFTNKPCILYCYDIKRYEGERDFYVPIKQWGFPIAETKDELVNIILNFDNKIYAINMNNHHDNLGSYESGEATKKLCNLIVDNIL
jgi:CDP-glycerol glycerophosphotransferase